MDSLLIGDDGDFYEKLGKFLSPSEPIQSIEHLKGRSEELERVQEAIRTPGRHVFIYGVRGVGKTSLASTAAFLTHPSHSDPPIVSCDPASSPMEFFETIARKVGDISLRTDRVSSSLEGSAGIGPFKLGQTLRSDGWAVRTPRSVDEAVSQIQELLGRARSNQILIVDEFDRPEDKDFRTLFGDFIKQLSDRRVPLRLIVCGVATSLEDLLAGHSSAFRYICDVELDRLPFQARIDIIESASKALNLEIDAGYIYRICHLSDGFAHFVHLVTRQLVLKMRDAQCRKAGVQEFNAAVRGAVKDVNVTLRMLYEKATEKYSNKDEYEAVLWATADSPELKRRSADIFQSANGIREYQSMLPMTRKTFNSRLNSLKKDSHGPVLTGSRAGWYEFKETMLRGYCCLRAEQTGLTLDVDTFNEANAIVEKGSYQPRKQA